MPSFMISEVHVINETGPFLVETINEIGFQLKTNATCTQARRVRFGDFTLHHALLRKQWYSKAILENIKLCKPLCEGLRKKGKSVPKILEKTKLNKTKQIDDGTNSEQFQLPG